MLLHPIERLAADRRIRPGAVPLPGQRHPHRAPDVGRGGCLNPLALQWFERERGRLALGDPLPFPHGRLAAGDGVPPAGDDEEDPMAWEETTAGEPQ